MKRSNEIKICVCGLGYVGLPLFVKLSEHFDVVGVDINTEKLNDLKNGIDVTGELSDSEKSLVMSLELIDNMNALEADVFIVTVPTPVSIHNVPDLSILKDISDAISKCLKPGNLVIYESTVYPGATDDICIPILEMGSKLQVNRDFGVAYSPERINPSDKVNTLKTTTKLIGASSNEYLGKAKSCYQNIVDSIYICDSIKIAEAAKVLENTQRDVNIALMNEVSKIFSSLGIDTHKVLEAASTKWNFHRYFPGFVGGHCIGVDPYYLTSKAQLSGIRPELMLTARSVNEGMPKFLFEHVIRSLLLNQFDIKSGRILVLGATFKPNCADTRNSKVFTIVDYFKRLGISVDIFDILADDVSLHDENLLNQTHAYDCIALMVPHQYFLDAPEFYVSSNLKSNGIFIDLHGSLPELHADYEVIKL